MTRPSITIIGGGIVGATAAYYLTRNKYQVTLFDEGTGQATKAAAGIINPWFSLRRNKPWYFLVSQGAEFYRQFMRDLSADGYDVSHIFQADGALMVRRTDKRLKKDLDQAETKRVDAPSIGQVKTVSAHNYLPLLMKDLPATFVEGGGRVDGLALIETLHQAIQKFGGRIIRETAHLDQTSTHEIITRSDHFEVLSDKILLAAGAWLPQLLEPLGYDVDIQPQKGQLYSIYNSDWVNQHWPVVMPPGTADIIPFNNGEIIIGATHENDQGYNLDVDTEKLKDLQLEAGKLAPSLLNQPIHQTKVGTRAQTSDYSVLVGAVPALENTWAVSGLGSSGLTSGPYIGFQWAKLIQTGQWEIDPKDFPINQYITKK